MGFLPRLPLGKMKGVMEINHPWKSLHPGSWTHVWHILTLPQEELPAWTAGLSTGKGGSRATAILSLLAVCWFRQLPVLLKFWTIALLSEQKAATLGLGWIFLTHNMLWPFHRATRESRILRKLVHPGKPEGLLDKGVTDLSGTNCDHPPNCHLDVRSDLKLRLEILWYFM